MASSSIVYREDPEGTVGRIFSREELVEKVRAERREDDEKMREYMEYLKRWIKAQPHLAETGKQGKRLFSLFTRHFFLLWQFVLLLLLLYLQFSSLVLA